MLTQPLPTIPKQKEFCPKPMRTYDVYLHLTIISVYILDFNIQDFPATRRRKNKRKASNAQPTDALVLKPGKTLRRSRSQIVYICPKCSMNYKDDKGDRGEWLQCSGSTKCSVWGHIQCMKGDFWCGKCQKKPNPSRQTK